MSCCFCISDEPISDPRGRIKTRENENKFQINMVITAPFSFLFITSYTYLFWLHRWNHLVILFIHLVGLLDKYYLALVVLLRY